MNRCAARLLAILMAAVAVGSPLVAQSRQPVEAPDQKAAETFVRELDAHRGHRHAIGQGQRADLDRFSQVLEHRKDLPLGQ